MPMNNASATCSQAFFSPRPPFTEAEFEILYNHGINKEGNILDVGLQHGVVDKKGAWLQFQGELIGQGKDAARQTLIEKPEISRKIVEAIMAKRNGAAEAATSEKDQ